MFNASIRVGVSWEGLVKRFWESMGDWSKVIAESNIYGMSEIGQTFLQEWAGLVKCFAEVDRRLFLRSRWNWSNFFWEQMGLVKHFEVAGGIVQTFLWKFLCCSNFLWYLPGLVRPFVEVGRIGQNLNRSRWDWSKL